jgi:hypothetical protein
LRLFAKGGFAASQLTCATPVNVARLNVTCGRGDRPPARSRSSS